MRAAAKVKAFMVEKIPSFLLGIFSFSLLVFTQFAGYLPVKPPQSRYISPPPMLEHFTFGYAEILADSIWVRTIQDMDYCENSIAEVNGVSLCNNESWLYKMINTITNLSPRFRTPYAVGSLALTVLITDIEGASKIFDKAVAAFPNDWPILYRAAYHYLYEVKDNKKAGDLLVRAADNGAPSWTRTLAGRLYSDSGNIELAEKLLQEMKDTNQEPMLIKRLEAKIQSMKAISRPSSK